MLIYNSSHSLDYMIESSQLTSNIIHEVSVEVAKMLVNLHKTEQYVGTLHPKMIKQSKEKYYMQRVSLTEEEQGQFSAPETFHILKKGHSIQSDLYSFGVLLYLMYAGRLPIHLNQDQSWGEAHLFNEIKAIDYIDARLNAIIFKLLHKNPNSRYQTASGVLADLELLFDQSKTLKVVGEIDSFLDYTSKFKYDVQDKIVKAFRNFVENRQVFSSILIVSGLSYQSRKEVLNLLINDSDKTRCFFCYVDTKAFKDTTNSVLKTIINEYITLLSVSSSIQSLKKRLESTLQSNKTIINHSIPLFHSLFFQTDTKHDPVKQDDVDVNEHEEREILFQCLNIIHQYVKRPVIFIFNEETPNDSNYALVIKEIHKSLAHHKMVFLEQNEFTQNYHHQSTYIELPPLTFEDIRDILSKILQEDSEQVGILSQSLLFHAKGDISQLKVLFSNWVEAGLIYFNEDNYSWTYVDELIQNQLVTDELLTFMKAQFDYLSPEAKNVIAIAALIDVRVHPLLLADILEVDPLVIREAMEQAEYIGLVFYDRKDRFRSNEVDEYVFLNEQIRTYLSSFSGEQHTKWHFKIGTIITNNFKTILPNSEHLILYHYNLAHQHLNEEQLANLVYKNLEVGLVHLDKQTFQAFELAKYYFRSGYELCTYYAGQFDDYLYKFILYEALLEYVCGNDTRAKQLFKTLDADKDKLELNDLRKFYMWQLEINVFYDNETALNFGIEALKLFKWDVTKKVSVPVLIKEILLTQRFLKLYRLGKLHTKSDESEEFKLLCRTAYSISMPLAINNPKGLVYLYTRFLRKNLVEGVNNELSVIINLYELLLQRGMPGLYNLLPADTNSYLLPPNHYETYHYHVLRAVVNQLNNHDEVYPLLSQALKSAIEVNDYRSVNFVIMVIIVTFNEDVEKLKLTLELISRGINTNIDVNLKLLIDEFTLYYEAHCHESTMYECIFTNYDSTKAHINYISINRMELSLIAKEYERVLHWYQLAKSSMLHVDWISNRKTYIYQHLAMASLYDQTDNAKQKMEYKSKMKKFVKKIKKWHGYLGKDTSVHHLLLAEYHAMEERYFEAQSYFEKAIKLARDEKNSKFEAIALERLSLLFKRLHSETGKMIAQMDAVSAYAKYGMQSKVNVLSIEIQQPHLLDYALLKSSSKSKSKAKLEVTAEPSLNKVDYMIGQSDKQLDHIYQLQGHWNNQYFISHFLTLACRQFTADSGLLIKYKGERYDLMSVYGLTDSHLIAQAVQHALKFSVNTRQPFIYSKQKGERLLYTDLILDIKSFIIIPHRTTQDETYVLVLASQYFDHLFTQQEKLVLELLLSRFIILAEQSRVSSKQATTYLLSSVQPAVFTTLLEPLTEREVNILVEMVNGLSNEEICQKLNIKLTTVNTHINNIYSKLGVKQRAQAILKAKEMNLV